MGIIPLFDWGEANALFFMGNWLQSIKSDRWLKYLKLLMVVLSTLLGLMQFKSLMVVCLIDQVSHLWKALGLNLIEEARNEYKKLFEGGW